MLNKRIISAIIGLALFLVLLYTGGLALRIAVVMVTLLCMMELKGTLGSAYRLDDFLSAVVVALCFFLPIDLAMALVFIYFVALLALSLIMSPFDLHRVYMNGFAFAFILFPFLLLYRIIAFSPINNLYLLVFALAWGNDTFAYFVGTYFGSTHYTKISPNKTVEGALGGMIGGLLLIALIKVFFIKDVSFAALFLFGIVGSFAAQAGDLFGSYMKRSNQVKDFGIIMPGHGGMLDRFISVLFTAVVLYLLQGYF